MCARVRAALIARGVLVTLALLLTLCVGLGLVDYLLRLPMTVRLIAWAALLALTAQQWRRHIAPALRVRLSPTDMALRIEQRDPALRGILATALELSAPPHHDDGQGDDERAIAAALRGAALRTAQRRIREVSGGGVLRLGEIWRATAGLGAMIAVVVTLGVLAPMNLGVGAQRVLTPWSGASWPKRHAIVDMTRSDALAVDVAVPIRAQIGTSQSSTEAGARAVVSWRVLDERRKPLSEWARTMLVPQNKRDPVTGVPIFEQLIDVQGAAARSDDTAFTLEYRIVTRDDATATKRIRLVRPPELLGASVTIALPEYARPISGADLVREGTISSAAEETAVTPVLAGSRVELLWRFSKPIIAGSGERERPEWAGRVARENTVEAFDQPTPDSMRLVLTAQASVTIEPAVIDESGIPVRTPIVLGLGVLDDRAPGAVVTDPDRDEAVSPMAVLELSAELSDDLGLSAGSLVATHAASPDEGSAGTPPEPRGEPITLGEEALSAAQRHTLTRTLDVSATGAAPGDELWISAVARDLRAPSDAGVTRSARRVLRIVTEAELVEQIRQGLNPVRGALRQLDEQQAQLQQMLRDGDENTGREQRTLTARLDASVRTIEQLRRGARRNRIGDETLRSMLDDAAGVLGEARDASELAGEQADRGQRERAQASQRRVRDRVGELLSLLDRGQDAWLALRDVRQLRDELESLREDTGELSASTAGKSLDQLTPDERGALDRILERQLQSAQDAREALSTLDEQAAKLDETDPTQAQALREAAQQGRGAELEQRLRQAAAQIGANQTASASQTQQQALEDLEQMLQELENTIKNRDNALRRELASIIDSIKGLIDAQQAELSLLQAAMGGVGQEAGLDERMITLAANTLSVRDEAMGAFPETRSIAGLIKQAGDAQNGAIVALRAAPPRLNEAQRGEQAALLHLRSALEEAQRLDEQAAQRQAERLRDELRDAYKAALDGQTRLRDDTDGLMGQALSRRQRAQARAIAQDQDAIRENLSALLNKTRELQEAPVFTLAHDQLGRLMRQSSDGLGGREIQSETLAAQNGALVVLSSLVEVLSDSPPNQEEQDFEDGANASNGQGGGQAGGSEEPAIPPIAQLRLLRTMQGLAAQQTRSLSEQGPGADPDSVNAVLELQRQLFERGSALIESMNPAPPTGVNSDEDSEAGSEGGSEGGGVEPMNQPGSGT